MASVVEIDSKVPLKEYLMENAIVAYSLALWRQIQHSTLAKYCYKDFASDLRIIIPL